MVKIAHLVTAFKKSRTDKCTGLQMMPNCMDLKKPNYPTHSTPQMSKSFLEKGKSTSGLLKDPQRQMADPELQMLEKNQHRDVILCESAVSENNDFG